MALVQKAIDYLRGQGFKDEEIYTAFVIQTEFRPQPRIVDVVGIKSDYKVAIECGKTSPALLEMLQPYFDEVLHFPFAKGSPFYPLREEA